MIHFKFYGLLDFSEALAIQEQIVTDLVAKTEAQVSSTQISGTVMGFESTPVVTMGLRSKPQDLVKPASEIKQEGFKIQTVNRGGQATVHMPGQLVIFPVVRIRPFKVKEWVKLLLEVTQRTAYQLGSPLTTRANSPGLFSPKGKVVSIGLKMTQGASTHGLALNIHNELSPFSLIRTCGVEEAPMDRLVTSCSISEIFKTWEREFRELTSCENLPNLKSFREEARL